MIVTHFCVFQHSCCFDEYQTKYITANIRIERKDIPSNKHSSLDLSLPQCGITGLQIIFAELWFWGKHRALPMNRYRIDLLRNTSRGVELLRYIVRRITWFPIVYEFHESTFFSTNSILLHSSVTTNTHKSPTLHSVVSFSVRHLSIWGYFQVSCEF